MSLAKNGPALIPRAPHWGTKVGDVLVRHWSNPKKIPFVIFTIASMALLAEKGPRKYSILRKYAKKHAENILKIKVYHRVDDSIG